MSRISNLEETLVIRLYTSLRSVQNSQQKLGVVAKPQTDVENHYDISQDNFGEVLGSTSHSMAVYMELPNQSPVPTTSVFLTQVSVSHRAGRDMKNK